MGFLIGIDILRERQMLREKKREREKEFDILNIAYFLVSSLVK